MCYAAEPWVITVAAIGVGIVWLRVEARRFRAVWDALMDGLAPASPR